MNSAVSVTILESRIEQCAEILRITGAHAIPADTEDRTPQNARQKVSNQEVLKPGTQGRTRTGTPAKAGDFESPASTIPPLGLQALTSSQAARPEQVQTDLTAALPRGLPCAMIRRLYDWTMGWADHPRALWVLGFVAFIESSVFPIPPDVLMIPMILAAPHRAWLIASVCLVASVLGGLLGYGIGALAFESLGQPILTALGKGEAIEAFNTRFNDFGFWAVLTAGITPFPYKVITIMSGWTSMPLGTFIATSILARGLRFFIVAGLLWNFGTPIRDFIERRLGLMFTLFVVLLLGGFWVVTAL